MDKPTKPDLCRNVEFFTSNLKVSLQWGAFRVGRALFLFPKSDLSGGSPCPLTPPDYPLVIPAHTLNKHNSLSYYIGDGRRRRSCWFANIYRHISFLALFRLEGGLVAAVLADLEFL